jgi:hypothetical protein
LLQLASGRALIQRGSEVAHQVSAARAAGGTLDRAGSGIRAHGAGRAPREAHDFAPNGPPDWAYTIATGRLALSVTGSALAPKRPTAGKALNAALLIVRNDITSC